MLHFPLLIRLNLNKFLFLCVCGNIVISTSVAHALEHEECGDKVPITYHDFWILFYVMTTQLVGSFFSLFYFWNFFLPQLKLSWVRWEANANPKFVALKVLTMKNTTTVYVGGMLQHVYVFKQYAQHDHITVSK